MINFWLTIKSLLLVKLSQLKHLNSTERWLTRNTMKKFFDSRKVWTFSTCESRLLQRKLPNRAQKSPQQRLFLTKNFFQRTCLLNSGPGLFFSTIVKISWKLHRESFFRRRHSVSSRHRFFFQLSGFGQHVVVAVIVVVVVVVVAATANHALLARPENSILWASCRSLWGSFNPTGIKESFWGL